MYLALNNKQRLACHKSNQPTIYVYLYNNIYYYLLGNSFIYVEYTDT